MTEWQLLDGILDARLLIERPNDWPHGVVEVEQLLPDGTPIKVVWAWLPYTKSAKMVTAHFFDR